MKVYRETKVTHNPLMPTIYLIGDSHAGHFGAVMTHLVNKNKLNFVMHPRGNGLKLLNKKGDVISPEEYYLLNNNREEFILAPLREYKNNFKKGNIIIFSANITKYHTNEQDWTCLLYTSDAADE